MQFFISEAQFVWWVLFAGHSTPVASMVIMIVRYRGQRIYPLKTRRGTAIVYTIPYQHWRMESFSFINTTEQIAVICHDSCDYSCLNLYFFQAYTDLDCIVGLHEISIEGGISVPYEITAYPIKQGIYKGVFSFESIKGSGKSHSNLFRASRRL